MKKLSAFVAVPLFLLAGCSGTATTSAPAGSAPASTAPASPSATLPLVLTASGYVDYPMVAADCKAGNAFKKGDPITITDPKGTTTEAKLADASPMTGKDGSKRCQSSFGFSLANPTKDGQYTIKLGDKTKQLSAMDMLNSIEWSV